jgi:leader peptidase (prepilin peptidase)/N-methyltransferase
VGAWWLALLAAPFAGSFLYALVRRLPLERPDLWGRSRCEACGHALSARELLPIVSFVVQRGRCRACGVRIPAGHLAAELLCVLIAGAVVATGADGIDLWAGCLLGWTLLALAWIDLEHFLLPDALTLPLLLAGLAEAWLADTWSLTDRALGAVAGYLAFRLLAELYRRLRHREGLGQGDAKLLAAAGAWLGWQALPQVVLLAALLGLGLALLARLRGATLHAATALPFGPPLSAAIFLLWLARALEG